MSATPMHLVDLSAIFHIEDNFWDFLFALLHNNPLLQRETKQFFKELPPPQVYPFPLVSICLPR